MIKFSSLDYARFSNLVVGVGTNAALDDELDIPIRCTRDYYDGYLCGLRDSNTLDDADKARTMALVIKQMIHEGVLKSDELNLTPDAYDQFTLELEYYKLFRNWLIADTPEKRDMLADAFDEEYAEVKSTALSLLPFLPDSLEELFEIVYDRCVSGDMDYISDLTNIKYFATICPEYAEGLSKAFKMSKEELITRIEKEIADEPNC